MQDTLQCFFSIRTGSRGVEWDKFTLTVVIRGQVLARRTVLGESWNGNWEKRKQSLLDCSDRCRGRSITASLMEAHSGGKCLGYTGLSHLKSYRQRLHREGDESGRMLAWLLKRMPSTNYFCSTSSRWHAGYGSGIYDTAPT